MVSALYDSDPTIQMNSYNMIKTEITTSTTSMTSIPKPLKFMIAHYTPLKEYYLKLEETNTFKVFLSDLLAILVIVSPSATETSLSFVMTGTKNDIVSWGAEFIKYTYISYLIYIIMLEIYAVR